MDKKYTIALAHSFREQLADVVLDLPDFSVLNVDRFVSTNVREWKAIKMFGSFSSYLNFSSVTSIPIVSRIQKIFGLINFRIVFFDRRNVDIFFANGGFLFSRKPYITYIEKATQVFGYTAKNYNKCIGRWLLRNRLEDKKLKYVFFRTETAKKGFINTFKDDARIVRAIEKKGVYVYPPTFPARDNISLERFRNPEKVRFLFISSSFVLKGGAQMVRAFDALSHEMTSVELIIITKIGTIDQETLNVIRKNKKITLKEPMDRATLYTEYLLTSHCLVYPTFSDSFSMVINEAIGSFLPIITSDFFSIPERVRDSKNGFLFPSPYKNYNDEFVIFEEHFSDDENIIRRIYEDDREYRLRHIQKFLYEKMKILATDNDVLFRMAEASKEMYYERLDDIKIKKQVNAYFISAIS